MRILMIVVAVLWLAACRSAPEPGTVTLAELAATNQANLAKLKPGMSRSDAVAVMGDETASSRDGSINNPWTTEAFNGKDGAKYEVLYYVTRKNPPFTPVRKSLTTPVIIKNGQVVGWGDEALKRYN